MDALLCSRSIHLHRRGGSGAGAGSAGSCPLPVQEGWHQQGKSPGTTCSKMSSQRGRRARCEVQQRAWPEVQAHVPPAATNRKAGERSPDLSLC